MRRRHAETDVNLVRLLTRCPLTPKMEGVAFAFLLTLAVRAILLSHGAKLPGEGSWSTIFYVFVAFGRQVAEPRPRPEVA
jgi:hypothetical protein